MIVMEIGLFRYNQFMLLERIQTACREDCQLLPDNPVLVGVSGGPDSLCLLGALIDLGYPVVAACFDHALRPESADEVLLVAGLAEKMGFPFVTAREDVAALAERERLSVEEAARTARYRFLFHEARRVGAQAVAVGHTADDQVETVLMHLLRGAGLAGLKGMPARGVVRVWDEVIPVVRPLLDVRREETVAFCLERGLPAILDASNQDTTYFRNRLRHELIPVLQTYNPQVKEVIARTAKALAADYQVLEGVSLAAWEDCDAHSSDGEISLSLSSFRGLSTGLRRALLRRAVAMLRPALRDVDFDAIRRGEEFAMRPSRTGQIDLVSGLKMSIADGRLILAEWERIPDLSVFPQMETNESLHLPVPGRVALPSGWQLCAEIIDRADLPDSLANQEHAWLDWETLSDTLWVQTVRPGQRFQPIGMDGHSLKLSDFWVNRRLPRAARPGWPLVFSANSLAWVPLFGPAHLFRIKETTHKVVHLWVERDK